MALLVPPREGDCGQGGEALGSAATGLRHLLEDVVEAHMVADVPVGVFLSGGIDSAALVAMAAARKVESVRTFTVGFGDSATARTELEHARRVARRFATDHSEVLLGADDVADCFPSIVRAMDQPSVDGVNSYVVSEFAAGHVKVALSGLGADELWAGYPYFRRFQRFVPLAPKGIPMLWPAAAWASRHLPGRVAAPLRFLAASPGQRQLEIRDPLPGL